MIKLVLIDFDDTLCLTEEACFTLENSVAQKMGFPPMTREVHFSTWGQPLGEAILERVPGIDAELFMKEVEKALPEFIENGKLDAITDVNLETLNAIRRKGIKTAILTSRTFIEVRHLLDENHPLSPMIDAFFHKDNNEFAKPDPRAFDKPLRDFGLEPVEVVYVGDSIGDAVSAKEAGLHFIALLESELRSKEDFKSLSVDYIAYKFQDIIKYIDEKF